MLSSLSQGADPIEAKSGVHRGEDLVEEAKEKSPIAGAIRGSSCGGLSLGYVEVRFVTHRQVGRTCGSEGRSVDLNDANEFGLEVAIELLAKGV